MTYFLMVLLIVLGTAQPGFGGSLAISPVRIQLTNAERTAVITVENQGDALRIYQLEAVEWSQVDGKDVYSPTRDLIAVPPVFKLPPGKKQIVRVGVRKSPAAVENCYRVFIQELPVSDAASDIPTVQTVLRVGIPVFDEPAGRSDLPRLSWTPDQAGEWIIENPTNMHVQMGQITVRGGDEPHTYQGGFYLLPRERRRWTPTGKPIAGFASVIFEADTDRGPVVYESHAPH